MKEQKETNSCIMQRCGTRVIMKGMASQIFPIRSRYDYDSCIIYSANKNDAIKSGLKWEPMSEDWKENCKQKFWFQKTIEGMMKLHPAMDPRLFSLREHLLEFAGEAVCLPGFEEDICNILEYGQFWLGNNIKFIKGLPSQCHRNSCELYMRNREQARICTGYALSGDGLWRQHSWLIWMKPRSNQIVETTVPRIAYFGFVMTDEQCERFCEDNL